MIDKELPRTELEQRVEALERKNASLARRLALMAAALLTLPLLAWTAGRVFDEVRAREFTLVDAADRSRASLRLDDGGEPRFALNDRSGKPRLRLRLAGDEAFIDLLSAAGDTRMGLAIDAAGLPHMVLLDAEQRPRSQWTMNEAGAPGLMFVHSDGVISAGLGVDAKGERWEIEKPLRGSAVQPDKKGGGTPDAGR